MTISSVTGSDTRKLQYNTGHCLANELMFEPRLCLKMVNLCVQSVFASFVFRIVEPFEHLYLAVSSVEAFPMLTEKSM